jgi:putative endonuclease
VISPAFAQDRANASDPRLPMPTYHVYIVASITKTLYIGVTNDLRRRVYQHKTGAMGGFTSRYNVNRLVHYEAFKDIRDARQREKQLKGWVRRRKIELIRAQNPEWEDDRPAAVRHVTHGRMMCSDAPVLSGGRDPSVAPMRS